MVKKGKHEKEQSPIKKLASIMIVMVTILAFATGVFFLGSRASGSITEKAEEILTQIKVEKNKGTIDIPGYESLNLKAGTTEQNICLTNPIQNNCYFKISLLLEDGTVLWTSDLVKPGYKSDKITISQTLEAGTYLNAKLKYECFAMDAQRSALNGAETKLKLFVK